jgi:hypothetical protein
VTRAQDANAEGASALLLSLAREEASLAAEQLDTSRQLYERAQRAYGTGTSTFVEFLEAQQLFTDANDRLKLAELDIEEIESGGGPVRIDIAAPLVNGRDFLTERLNIAFDSISRRSTSLEQVIKFTEAEVEAGVATSDSVLPLTLERSRLAGEAERIRTMLALRQNELAKNEQASNR